MDVQVWCIIKRFDSPSVNDPQRDQCGLFTILKYNVSAQKFAHCIEEFPKRSGFVRIRLLVDMRMRFEVCQCYIAVTMPVGLRNAVLDGGQFNISTSRFRKRKV